MGNSVTKKTNTSIPMKNLKATDATLNKSSTTGPRKMTRSQSEPILTSKNLTTTVRSNSLTTKVISNKDHSKENVPDPMSLGQTADSGSDSSLSIMIHQPSNNSNTQQLQELTNHMLDIVKNVAGQGVELSDAVRLRVENNAKALYTNSITSGEQLDNISTKMFRHDAVLTAVAWLTEIGVNGTANYLAFKNPLEFKLGSVVKIDEKSTAESAAQEFAVFLMIADFVASLAAKNLKDSMYIVADVNEALAFINPDYQAANWRKVTKFLNQGSSIVKNSARGPIALVTGKDGVSDSRENTAARVTDNTVDSFGAYLLQFPQVSTELFEKVFVSNSYKAALFVQEESKFIKIIKTKIDIDERNIKDYCLKGLKNIMVNGTYNAVVNLPGQIIVTGTLAFTLAVLLNALPQMVGNGFAPYVPATNDWIEKNNQSTWIKDNKKFPSAVYPTVNFAYSRGTVGAYFSLIGLAAQRINNFITAGTKMVVDKAINVSKGAVNKIRNFN